MGFNSGFKGLNSKTKNRIQKGGNWVTHELWPSSTFVQLIHSAVLHPEQNAVSCWQRCPQSPGFIKWWPRCLNHNVAKAPQSQMTCGAISDACLHLSHSGLFISPRLNSSKALTYSFTLAPDGHPSPMLMGLHTFRGMKYHWMTATYFTYWMIRN